MCEHHLLPFIGKMPCSLPSQGKVSVYPKLPRIVDMFCRRLQIQETLVTQIAQDINR
ncbi:UNVERIFIED_CONTAM: hypothetical protein GTU68_044985 [Idotea baltica]|nr:hypothetical protein [Idotea baltica]